MNDPDAGGPFPPPGLPDGEARAAAPNPPGDGAAAAMQRSGNGSALSGNPDEPRKRKKRRRRKRGRKVFARDGQFPPVEPGPENETNKQKHNHEKPRRAPAPKPNRKSDRTYAALDLGTNNCRLLVAIPTRPGQFRVIDAFSRIVRLGEGLSTTGRLGDDAMNRSIDALRVCAAKLASRPGGRMRLIATEACRSADNGAEFLTRVREETGLKLEIINRETEARLAVSGCSSLVERGTEGVVLFDIGGGSSEIALVDLSRRRTPRLARHIVAWTSLPVGVVSLAEKFGGRHVSPETFEAMIECVSEMLQSFRQRGKLDSISKGPRFHLLGTSGTVTTLAGIHLGLERYDRRKVDGLWMTSSETDSIVETLMGWDYEQRKANACIGSDRADLVLAGCAILEAIRRTWPAERLRIADRGLREGILTEMMASDGVWRRNRQPNRYPGRFN
ncbi:MAG: Ppx/GppA phosphatase family protein [Rhizobiaceae bacterium]